MGKGKQFNLTKHPKIGSEKGRFTMIIDFRARPNTKEYITLLADPGIETVFKKMGHTIPKEGSLEDYIRDFETAGISKAVFTGRDIETTAKWKVSNDYVASVSRQYPDKVYGFAGIDPLKGGDAVREVFRSIRELGLKGVSMDPFAAGIYANDRKMYPIYEICVELDVPVILTLGPLPVAGTYISYGSPLPVDDVATEFPKLKVICSHSSWPFVYEMMAIAFRHDNVYIESSVYQFLPGAELMWQAANSILMDKIVFATGHPFAPFRETVERFKKIPLSNEALEKVTFKNAAKLLKIETETPSGWPERSF
jgi:predicted TIM-barrel fold metal-dependent hydrolase